jgi:hypothetical protein
VFLHSYAGHGSYLDHIPAAFKAPVDASLAGLRIRGDADGYDSTIRYVDYSVARSIAEVGARHEPVVLVYFSDHGESSYTGLAHDSSRFVHEMARIPFVMYFNEAARLQYAAEFRRYRALASKGSVSTLAQLPATLVDLLGGDLRRAFPGAPPVIGSAGAGALPPILVRRTADGVSGIDLDPAREVAGAASPLRNGADYATTLFIARHAAKAQDSRLCYRQAGSLAEIHRAAIVADCLELAVTVDAAGDARLDVPDVPPRQFLSIAGHRRLALWIDARAVKSPTACRTLARQLEAAETPSVSVLEFHGDPSAYEPQFADCLRGLGDRGFRVALRVDDADMAACKQGTERTAGLTACDRLASRLAGVVKSGLFSDVSFDARYSTAMDDIGPAHELRWDARPGSLAGLVRPDGSRFAAMVAYSPDMDTR